MNDIDPFQFVRAFGDSHDQRCQSAARGDVFNEWILEALFEGAKAFRGYFAARDLPISILDLLQLEQAKPETERARWIRRTGDYTYSTYPLYASQHGTWELVAQAHWYVSLAHRHMGSEAAHVTFAKASVNIIGNFEFQGNQCSIEHAVTDTAMLIPIFIAAPNTVHATVGVAPEGVDYLALALVYRAAPVELARP